MNPSRDIARLIEIMAALRTPGTGCPWDLTQDFASIAPYTIEEAYEVADAIARGDLHDLRDELGDLLLQVVFHARMAEEEGAFDFGAVVEAITAKLVRRHPHVFGDAVAETPEDVAARWEVLKKAEKGRASVTDGIPRALPALALAAKLQRKAESLGLDTGSLGDRRRQIATALDALAGLDLGGEAHGEPAPESSGETLEASAETEAAIGEMLFAVADAARRLGVDPETALRGCAGSFRRRIEAAEAHRG